MYCYFEMYAPLTVILNWYRGVEQVKIKGKKLAPLSNGRRKKNTLCILYFQIVKMF